MSEKHYGDSPPPGEPPPYSAIAESGTVTLESSVRPPRHSSRPHGQSRPPASSSHSSSHSHGYSSSGSSSNHGNYSGGNYSSGSGGYGGGHGSSRYEGRYDSGRPHGPPGPRPSGHYHNAPMQGSAVPPPPPQSMPAPNNNPYLRYPRGYWCPRCNNTGVKINKGTTCQDCFERFGVNRQQVQYLPYGMSPVFTGPPRVVQPGDPSIGGVLCGRCRGSGMITDLLFFDSPCPLCRGVGRVF